MAPRSAVLAVAFLLAACEQESQELPFAVAPEEESRRTVGSEGGTVSTARGLSLEIPPGAVSGPVEVRVRPRTLAPDAPPPIPDLDGSLLPGTVFEIEPAGLSLSAPASLSLRFAPGTLDPGDALRLGLAAGAGGEGSMVDMVSVDLGSGIVTGDIERLGTVAGRLAADALAVSSGTPPSLGGGSFGAGGSGRGPAGSPGGGAPRFRVRCGATGAVPRCRNADAARVWASGELRERVREDFVVVGPRLEGWLEFTDFVAGSPTRVVGELRVEGVLRARVGRSVTSFRIDERFTTGEGAEPRPAELGLSGNTLIIRRTSEGTSRTFAYEIRPVGTGEQLVLETEETVELENADGTTTTGVVSVRVRLRRE